ncbi:MAG: methionyl-tRNA formyltransferase [Nitriliruptoraceae bacterium]
MTLRIAFFGTPEIALPGLRALINAHGIDVSVVVTNPDRPRGRRGKPVPPAVKVTASEHGIDVWQPVKPLTIEEPLRALDLDVAAVIAYGAILPETLLAATRHGFVNLHFSLLPRWRGAAPVQHALRAGDSITGVTAFKLDAGMDTGPIIAQQTEPIAVTDDAGSLLDRLAGGTTDLFVGAIRSLCAGSELLPQDHTAATYAPKLTKGDAVIDFSPAAPEVINQIRSVNPVPGARTSFRDRQLKVFRAEVASAGWDAEAPAGSIVSDRTDVIGVACGRGAVHLLEVQPEGKRRQQAAEFVRGYRPQPGERLGTGALP